MDDALADFVRRRAGDCCEYCRLPQWSRHFRWQGPVLIGRTPSGRATIAVLAMNLPHRVAQRAALIAEGVFPPAAP